MEIFPDQYEVRVKGDLIECTPKEFDFYYTWLEDKSDFRKQSMQYGIMTLQVDQKKYHASY